MTIREINAVEELVSLREEWSELLQITPRANFFQSLDWLEVYWKHFGATQKLRVLVVETNGTVSGILPLVVRKEWTKIGPLKYLTYPLDDWGSFYGPIGHAPNQVWAECLDYLNTVGLGADLLELRWIGCEQGECESLRQLLRAAHFTPELSYHDSTAVIELSGTWEAYLASRSGKWRNNFRRWERQVNSLGEITYFRYRPEAAEDVSPGWEYYDDCLRLASLSWQGSSSTGTTLTHVEVAPFLRDVHDVAARCGCLDLNLLYLDGRAVAFAYNYFYAGYVYGLRVGYDPTLPCKGAGNLLCARAIEDSFQRGDWRYDLGPRHLDCKRKILTDVLPVSRLSCYSTWSVRQQMMRMKRQWDAQAGPVDITTSNYARPISTVVLGSRTAVEAAEDTAVVP